VTCDSGVLKCVCDSALRDLAWKGRQSLWRAFGPEQLLSSDLWS
jgi:hypothetical protein